MLTEETVSDPKHLEVIRKIAEEMFKDLKTTYRPQNLRRKRYIEDKVEVRSLGISDPPRMRKIRQGNGWSRLVITELQERVQFEGWYDEENEYSSVLNRVYDDNNLETESQFTHGDSFSYGLGFVAVSYGDEELGEPKILVTPESPFNTTHRFNLRTRRPDWVLNIRGDVSKRDRTLYGVLYGCDANYDFVRLQSGRITIETVTVHNRGRVQVVGMPNNRETGSGNGHSEITESVFAVQDDALRTLSGMAINREAYSYKQRWIIGLHPEQLQDEEGNDRDVSSLMATAATVLPPNKNDVNPSVGTWETGEPTQFTAVYRQLAQIFSSTTSIPASRLISNDANPTSGDAIRQNEGPIIKKAEAKIRALSTYWNEVGKLILLLEFGQVPEEFKVKSRFREPDSAARQSNAQEAQVLIQNGILQPDSLIVMDRVGLSRAEQEIVKAENLRARTAVLTEALASTPAEVVDVPAEVE